MRRAGAGIAATITSAKCVVVLIGRAATIARAIRRANRSSAFSVMMPTSSDS